MAKYTGPVCKICRREGEKLFLKGDRCHTEKCSFDRRPYPPGEHGKSNLRKKQSDFGLHLREKQKVKRMYSLMENQFRNYYKKADQTKGMTGLMLLQLLERRLDNIIFRLNFAPSRKAARQLVTHSHFSVNGKSVRIPSFIVDEGDEIQIKENKRDKKIFKVAMEVAKQNPIVEWLEVDPDNFKGIIKRLPEREDMPQNI